MGGEKEFPGPPPQPLLSTPFMGVGEGFFIHRLTSRYWKLAAVFRRAGTARHGYLDMESFHVRDFLFIREIFSGTGFQPVQMQAKACG
ncbi:MAG: hypothetical protein A3K23_06895 [Desulfobacca sp. RBG_16_58_9]|nr:MAG: hypothetical protein A3K23_06895 [Desulfobacca sp. RBG_16_58_9]